jgi:hypothetical protein
MSISRIALSLAGALASLTVTAPQAHASVLFTLQEVGSDVVGTGSGTINTSALHIIASGGEDSFIYGPNADLALGPTSFVSVNVWQSISGPGNFGGGPSFAFASSGSGDLVEVFGASGCGCLYLPSGYVSGAALSDSATWSGATFASLGVTPGTYLWTWGSGPTADSLTLMIGTPEPNSLTLLGVGLGILAAMRRRPYAKTFS